jgi:PEP-CTERM motif
MHTSLRLLTCGLVALSLHLMSAPRVLAGPIVVTEIDGTYTSIMPPQGLNVTSFNMIGGTATAPFAASLDDVSVQLGTFKTVLVLTVQDLILFPVNVISPSGTVSFFLPDFTSGTIDTSQPHTIVITNPITLNSVDPTLSGYDFQPLEDAKLIYTIFNVELIEDGSGQEQASWDTNQNPVSAEFKIVSAVPEPGALTLALLGLAGMGWLQRRWRQTAVQARSQSAPDCALSH